MTDKPKEPLTVTGYVNGVPVAPEVIRALWPKRKMTLAESLAYLMAEYIAGARKLPTGIEIDHATIESMIEQRLRRYISADQIAAILSEDANLQNGNLNVGYLAVKIAETVEGKRNTN